MKPPLKHFLFAIILGFCVACTEMFHFRNAIIMIPLAFAGLYVGAITAASNVDAITGIAWGGLIAILVLTSATLFVFVAVFILNHTSEVGIVASSKRDVEIIWVMGSIVLIPWFLFGVVLRLRG